MINTTLHSVGHAYFEVVMLFSVRRVLYL